MLLNGWKEIAAYLRSGVRTVQRWERIGMPVIRARPGDRGAVMARTETLDVWLRGRSVEIGTQVRPEIAAAVSRAAKLHERAADELRVLLETELKLGISLAQVASQSKNGERAARQIGMATQAYNTILRLSRRTGVLKLQTKQFARDLERLKDMLQKLGENVPEPS